jgi:hypothetical protein
LLVPTVGKAVLASVVASGMILKQI